MIGRLTLITSPDTDIPADRPLPWRALGACRGVDTDLFFPDEETTPAELAEARRVCASCPVSSACTEHGLRHEKHGIWGGLTEHERRRIRRRQRIRMSRPDGAD